MTSSAAMRLFRVIGLSLSTVSLGSAIGAQQSGMTIEEARPPRSLEVADCPAALAFEYQFQDVWVTTEIRRFRCRGMEELSLSQLRIEAPKRRKSGKAELFFWLEESHDKLVKGRVELLDGSGDAIVSQPFQADVEEGRGTSKRLLSGLSAEVLQETRRVRLEIQDVRDD